MTTHPFLLSFYADLAAIDTAQICAGPSADLPAPLARVLALSRRLTILALSTATTARTARAATTHDQAQVDEIISSITHISRQPQRSEIP